MNTPKISRFLQGGELLPMAFMILLEDNVSLSTLDFEKIEASLLHQVKNEEAPKIHLNHYSEHQLALFEKTCVRKHTSVKNGVTLTYFFKDKSKVVVTLKERGQMARPLHSPSVVTYNSPEHHKRF